MNEHIRQPAEQARKYADENRSGSFVKYDPEWFVLYNEKFAELIVRQCAEICLEANDHKNILRYFGVEE
jgi:hypothetical protein